MIQSTAWDWEAAGSQEELRNDSWIQEPEKISQHTGMFLADENTALSLRLFALFKSNP